MELPFAWSALRHRYPLAILSFSPSRAGRAGLALLIALAWLALAPTLSRAASGNYGLALSPAPGDQRAPIVTQTGYNTTVAWTDYRNGVGDIWWALMDSSAAYLASYVGPWQQGEQHLVGGRGPWVAWIDSTTDSDIGIATGLSSGWGGPGADTRQVVIAPGEQVAPRAYTLPTGASLVAWQDGRLGAANNDIYITGVAGSGPPVPPGWFPAPIPVCSATGNQSTPAVCSDGGYGVIVAWADARSGSTDIYAQHVLYDGTMQWLANGRPVCTAPQAQAAPELVSDGAGGAIIAWVDYRNGNADIYAQRVNPAGGPMWTANGVPVCVAAGSQDGIVLNSDFSGGAYVGWVDARNGQDIYAEHLDALGTSMWSGGVSGNGVCMSYSSPGLQRGLRGDSDSLAFYLAWEDRQANDSDIHATAVGPWLTPLWDVVVCAAPGDQTSPSIAADTGVRRGGAVVAWQDGRLGAGHSQVYAQRILPNGTFALADTDRPRLTSVRDVRNDQGGRLTLSFTGGPLDRIENRLITEFRVWRRVPPTSAIVAQAPVAGRLAGSLQGRYIAKPSGALASSANPMTYWEAIATLPAQQIAGYAFTASTNQDSVAGSNPYTAFFVTALTADPYRYFESNVDSCYSVDNLPPAMVQQFTGWGTPTSTALHWAVSREADFATYRVYRGSSAAFDPAAGNLVTDQPDTGYVDVVAGSHFYKVVAVDAHGNVSPAALLSPANTTSVEGAAPGRLWLASPSPNPVKREAGIAYGLARDGVVSLELYDVRGARVRTLAAGMQPPGEHLVRWDGRNQAGEPQPNGVYFYRLATSEGTLTRRLVLSN